MDSKEHHVGDKLLITASVVNFVIIFMWLGLSVNLLASEYMFYGDRDWRDIISKVYLLKTLLASLSVIAMLGTLMWKNSLFVSISFALFIIYLLI